MEVVNLLFDVQLLGVLGFLVYPVGLLTLRELV